MRTLATIAAAVFVVALAGCTAREPGGGVDASLEIGTGTWRFEPIADGQEIPLVRGAQGGWHVWVSLRAAGMVSTNATLDIEIQPADESREAQRAAIDVRLDPPEDDGTRSLLGWPAILEDPSCSVGELLRVRATLTDDAGNVVSAECYLVPTGGDDPPPACGS